MIPYMGIRTISSSQPPLIPSPEGLAAALFSATQRRVLGLLFGEPERTFFITELISLVGAGSGAVQREVRRLAESGLLTVTYIGRQKHYQANREAPIFEELRSIVVKTLGLAEVLRTALALLNDHIQLALLYGSVAKGKDTARSDIDLLIVSDVLTLEQTYEALAPVEQGLGRRISPTLYTTAEFQRRRAQGNAFLTKVLAGNTLLLITKDNDVLAPR